MGLLRRTRVTAQPDSSERPEARVDLGAQPGLVTMSNAALEPRRRLGGAGP